MSSDRETAHNGQRQPENVCYWTMHQSLRVNPDSLKDVNVSVIRKKAESGDPLFQEMMAHLYYEGVKVCKDRIKAQEWYRKAAEQGNISAQYNLASLDFGDKSQLSRDEKCRWLTSAANMGHVEAQYRLGVGYKEGIDLVADHAAAVHWFTKAAEADHDMAQLNLGRMYELGESVAQDKVEACRWYRRSAEQGNARAKAVLSTVYLSEHASLRNPAEGLRLLREAAEMGDCQAQFRLGLEFRQSLPWHASLPPPSTPLTTGVLSLIDPTILYILNIERSIPPHLIPTSLSINLASSPEQAEPYFIISARTYYPRSK